MKRLLRYLMRDKVDLIMFILTLEFTILFFIKTPDISPDLFKDGNFSIWLPVICLFILVSTIYTKGTTSDIMNEYITDPVARKELHLDKDIPPKSTMEKVISTFFTGLFAGILIFIFIVLLINS